MSGMFQKKKSYKFITQNLKKLIVNKFKLNDETTISIAELNCHEPNCPPIETIITERAEGGRVRNWRIAKPIIDIREIDIKNLNEEHNHEH